MTNNPTAYVKPVRLILLRRGNNVHPAPAAHPNDLGALRQDFVAAGYSFDNIADLLGPTATAALDRDQAPCPRAVFWTSR